MIAILPARSGSKGLPGKNTKLLNGKPMLAYTIEAAKKSKYIEEIIISTDDQKIFDLAIEEGATGKFLRPKELSGDTSLAIDNYIYTAERLNKEFGYSIKNIVVLQPTSPLRTVEDIDSAIELFLLNNADSVISYTEESHPVTWHKYIEPNGVLINIFPDNINNRQVNRPSFYPNGAVYVFSLSLLKSGKYFSSNSFASLMPRKRSIDIDTIEDFEYAEFLIRKQK